MKTKHSTSWLVALMILVLGAWSITGPSLPGGYTIIYGDRGKAWVAKPGGGVEAGLIGQLYNDDRHILLITTAHTFSYNLEAPHPVDGYCVAVLIDTKNQWSRRVRLAEAEQVVSGMTRVASHKRGCHLKGEIVSLQT